MGYPALLAAYEIERRPITDQVSRYAMATSLARTSQRQRSIPVTIEQPGPEGDAIRDRIGREAYDINVGQFCCGGLNFGYFYAGSPIIAYDGESAPAYDVCADSANPPCRDVGRRICGFATDGPSTTYWVPTSRCFASIWRLTSMASSKQLLIAPSP